jgi:hypothetical protein
MRLSRCFEEVGKKERVVGSVEMGRECKGHDFVDIV